MLALHGQYDAKKAELTDQAYVEKGKKADIEIKLEKKYAEVDEEVSVLCSFSYTIEIIIILGSKAAFSWEVR